MKNNHSYESSEFLSQHFEDWDRYLFILDVISTDNTVLKLITRV